MRFTPCIPHYWHVGGGVEGRTGAGTTVAIRNPASLLRSLTIQGALCPPGPARDYLDRVCSDLRFAIAEQARWQQCAAA